MKTKIKPQPQQQPSKISLLKVPRFDIQQVFLDPKNPTKSISKELNLYQIDKKKWVLFFYPKDSTPGCTTECIEFNELISDFLKLDCLVFGVSRDSQKSHEKFICKYDFNLPLISDIDEKLCQHFDVIKEKNMYGKKVFGIERSTFIFDENKKLIKEYRKVKAEGHAAQVLTDIKNLFL